MKLFKYLFLGISIIFGLLLLGPLFGYSYLYQFYQYYVVKAARLTGLNTYLLKAIGLLYFLPFAYGIRLLFHPLKTTRRKLGYGLAIGVFACYNLTFFALTRNQNFSVAEGQTLRWYSIRDGKVEYYDRAGFDPKTGVALKPVTAAVAPRLLRWERGGVKRIDPKADQFFDPLTGDALIWYAKTDARGYEFFDGPGFDPSNREPLHEVTPQVFQAWSKVQQERAAEQDLKTAGSQGQNFATGHDQPLRWYSLRDGTVHYFGHAGVDPVTGTQLQPVTPENAKQLLRWEHGEVTRVEPKDGHFFNTITGDPLYWYAKSADGLYEFFDGPGFHPTTRTKLEPVTPEIVLAWQQRQQKQQQEQAARPIPEGAASPASSTTPTEFAAQNAEPGERFPVTRLRLLQANEVKTWPYAKLRYAINEMFARHGAQFRDRTLSEWFQQFPWYHPKSEKSFAQIEAAMPDVEQQNMKLLAYFRDLRGRPEQSADSGGVPATIVYEGVLVAPRSHYDPPRLAPAANPLFMIVQGPQGVQSALGGQRQSFQRQTVFANRAWVRSATNPPQRTRSAKPRRP